MPGGVEEEWGVSEGKKKEVSLGVGWRCRYLDVMRTLAFTRGCKICQEGGREG